MVSNWDYRAGFNLAINQLIDDVYGTCWRTELLESDGNNLPFIHKIAIMLKLTGDSVDDAFDGCESIKRKIEICRDNYIEIPDTLQKIFDERATTLTVMSYFFNRNFLDYLKKNFILPKFLGSGFGSFNKTTRFYFLANNYFYCYLNLERTNNGFYIYKDRRFSYKDELGKEVKKDLKALILKS